jgi:hypothetical protein
LTRSQEPSAIHRKNLVPEVARYHSTVETRWYFSSVNASMAPVLSPDFCRTSASCCTVKDERRFALKASAALERSP